MGPVTPSPNFGMSITAGGTIEESAKGVMLVLIILMVQLQGLQ